MRRCEVTVDLLALYLIMRQPNIDLQWLSAAFSDVALFLEQPDGGLSNQKKNRPTHGVLLEKDDEKEGRTPPIFLRSVLQRVSPAYLEPLAGYLEPPAEDLHSV